VPDILPEQMGTVPEVMPTLSPCPFCAGQAVYTCRSNDSKFIFSNDVDHWIYCETEDCCVHVGMCETREEAIAAWERRAPVEIRPLTWQATERPVGCWSGQLPFHTYYEIEANDTGFYPSRGVFLSKDREHFPPEKTMEAAQAVCEADWRKRVGAALVPQPDHASKAVEEPAALTANQMAEIMMAEWKRVDPKSNIAQHMTSYVATFADMARAVVAAAQEAQLTGRQ